ncbi:MAG TPA: glycosyltransferase [Planctomycetota bacterium]|nr:glycosyltransferase [Planctomycetota bacterium]
MRTSVVIPTYNAGDDMPRLLAVLRAQKPSPPDEILAIDSGSRDQTCQHVRDAGGKVIEYREPFNHGLTRDAGIRASSGEIVLLTVQDAVPASDEWLARVVAHFSDPKVAGVTTRQIPPLDGPLELKIKADLDAREGVQRVTLADHEDYAKYTPAQKIELYRFDNVCSALRRSVWEQIPFGACRYAEDYQWAKKALEAGHAIVRDPSAPMIHAHRRSFCYEFRRGLLDAWVLDEAFGYRYSFLKKLNRVKMLAAGASDKKSGGRSEAFKTYSAHAMARCMYGCWRWTLKPLGLGRGAMESFTRGI